MDVPDEEGFGTEASAILEEMVQGQMLQAQIVGQEEDGIPYIQLYSSDGQTVRHAYDPGIEVVDLYLGFRQCTFLCTT